MAQFTHDDVNTEFGFYGTLSNWGNVSRTQVMALYNQMVDMLGGDPNVARQYLDSIPARHFVDGLTFLVDKDTATAEEIAAALPKSKTDRNTSGFWKRFSRFRPYESAKTPAHVVDRLLGESIGSLVDELKGAVMRSGAGKIVSAEVMDPEQVALLGIELQNGGDLTVHVVANPDGSFEFCQADANGDFSNDYVQFNGVNDFLAKNGLVRSFNPERA